MTESEWLAAAYPLKMLDHLDSVDALTDRKQRLLDCACVRRLWQVLGEPERSVIEIAERYADGLAELDELREVRGNVLAAIEAVAEQNVRDINSGSRPGWTGAPHTYSLLSAVAGVAWEYRSGTNPLAHSVEALCVVGVTDGGSVGQQRMRGQRFAEQRHQVALLREIFGNPFRPAEFSRDWQTSTAVSLARQMYQTRDFGAMPILADALQDAGCDSGDILDHCRGPGPHVRGCWVVDLVLGKG